MALSGRQTAILRFITDYRQANDYAPSVQEIADAVGLSSKHSVTYQLGELERLGWLRRNGRIPRSIVVLRQPEPAPVP